jgi:anti-sigma factor RsiW
MNGASEHDETRLDAVAVYALGALPEAEAREIAAHIAVCAICAAEYAALRGSADLIGYAAETAEFAPTELQSRRMKNALVAAVRAGEASAPPAAPPSPSAAPALPRVPWLAYLAAAACLAVAFLSTAQLNNVRAQHEADVRQVAQLQAQLQAQASTEARARALLAEVIAPSTQRYPVPQGLVARGNGRIILALQHLPALPKGKVYQAWTLRRGAKAVAPSITFTPDATGTLLVELPESAGDLAAVAMSVEPAGGSKAPSTKPAFVRPLS